MINVAFQKLGKRQEIVDTLLISSLGVLVIFSAVILGLRLHAVWQYGHLFSTSGIEGPGVYGIWRAQHGIPVYDRPVVFPYILALYNYLFYHSYGTILSFVRITDQDILREGRFLTFFFAVFGAICHWKILKHVLASSMDPKMLFFSVATIFLTWFSGHYVNWWVLTLRPDIPALAIGILGVLLFLKRQDFGAICCFYLEWAFKQNFITLLFSIFIYLALIERDFKRLLRIAVPCFFLFGATLWCGGENYRWNAFVAPSISSFSISEGVSHFLKGVIPSPWLWIGLTSPLFILNHLISKKNLDSLHLATLFFTIASFTSFLLGFVYLCKDGSHRNQTFECLIATVTLLILTLEVIKRYFSTDLQIKVKLAAVFLVLFSTVVPALQFIYPDRFHGFGMPQSDYQIRNQFMKTLRELPKPSWINDEILAQPWILQHPTIIIDSVFYTAAHKKHILKDGGVEESIKRNRFKTIALPSEDPLYQTALNSGYEIKSIFSRDKTFPDPYVSSTRLTRRSYFILSRSKDPPSP